MITLKQVMFMSGTVRGTACLGHERCLFVLPGAFIACEQ